MATVTKRDLVERIANRSGQKKPIVRDVVQEFLDQVIAELKKGNRLEFRDFGVFEVRERAARRAQNPKTLERVEVKAKRSVKFKAGRLMRDSVELGAPQSANAQAHAAGATMNHTAGHATSNHQHVEYKPTARSAGITSAR
ncbi:MAG: HU family DNA-binding protein [Phycisphaerales bacterium]